MPFNSLFKSSNNSEFVIFTNPDPKLAQSPFLSAKMLHFTYLGSFLQKTLGFLPSVKLDIFPITNRLNLGG
jgi:hypothetical protein